MSIRVLVPLLFVCTLGGVSGLSAQNPVAAPAPHAPPSPPPIETRTAPRSMSSMAAPPDGVLYSIGEPTGEEQFYLELINRARANPPAEGLMLAATTDPEILAAISFFGVDLGLLVAEFNAISPAPPISPSAPLTAAARGHSSWMFSQAVQSHTGAGGSSAGNRITAEGYVWTTWGENIFSYAESVFHGHAGFQIDWGSGVGGMQGPPRGHRVTIHNASFREVGIGVVNGTNTVGTSTVGPQLVTQNFATAAGSSPFVTGVVYYDLNGNSFYDPGEGVGGVTVTVAGSSNYAVTAASGGYSVPVPNSNAVRAVEFSGLGFLHSATATIAGLANAKVDFMPAYAPPVVSGPAVAVVGAPNPYTFSAVGGATAYEWHYARKVSADPEPCENLSAVTTDVSPGYSVVDTAVKDAGSASFHLAHPAFASQLITLNATYLPGPGSSLQFRSRLGWATALQTARVQVAAAGSDDWTDLYVQNGTGTAGETAFVTRSVALGAYAGSPIRIRFAYTVAGSAYPQTSAGVGWYVDAMTFPGVAQLEDAVVESVGAGTAFSFVPPSAGAYVLGVRPVISGSSWAYGPQTEVTAEEATGYAGWVASEYPALTGGPTDDHEKDGMSNLVEYAFGFDPTSPTSSSLLPQPVVTGGIWQVAYSAPAHTFDVVYGAQWSTDLVEWTDIPNTGSGLSRVFTFDPQASTRVFFRHVISLSPGAQ